MAHDKTAVTELATALGCLDHGTAGWAVLQRPGELLVPDDAWEQLERSLHDPALATLAQAAFDNGVAFAAHPEGLAGRRPERIEWTGGQRPIGDQAIPADLRIDRVYLVSCKYFSKVLHNAAPARVFDHLLRTGERHDRTDWYSRVAPDEHAALARAASAAVGCDHPAEPAAATPDERRTLRDALRVHGRAWPGDTGEYYRAMCRAVSEGSARRWRAAASTAAAREQLVWRLLRLNAAPYFVVGLGRPGAIRLRIDTPWDFRSRFDLLDVAIEADDVGQPQVRWHVEVHDRARGVDQSIDGHVEIRWSHGRFGAPPEAKVYLDTPLGETPGYVPLD